MAASWPAGANPDGSAAVRDTDAGDDDVAAELDALVVHRLTPAEKLLVVMCGCKRRMGDIARSVHGRTCPRLTCSVLLIPCRWCMPAPSVLVGCKAAHLIPSLHV